MKCPADVDSSLFKVTLRGGKKVMASLHNDDMRTLPLGLTEHDFVLFLLRREHPAAIDWEKVGLR